MRDNDKQSDIIDKRKAITLKEWKDKIDNCVGQKKKKYHWQDRD